MSFLIGTIPRRGRPPVTCRAHGAASEREMWAGLFLIGKVPREVHAGGGKMSKLIASQEGWLSSFDWSTFATEERGAWKNSHPFLRVCVSLGTWGRDYWRISAGGKQRGGSVKGMRTSEPSYGRRRSGGLGGAEHEIKKMSGWCQIYRTRRRERTSVWRIGSIRGRDFQMSLSVTLHLLVIIQLRWVIFISK